MYDLIIIGASAAGLSAGIYAARRNLNFVILSKDIGGEVATSGEIENWPGIIHTDGITLARQFHDHAKSYNIAIEDGREVMSLTQKDGVHVVETIDGNGEKKMYETKSVIIASGIHPKNLNLPGEKELKGRGITSCTVCDGPLYKKKTTATIGAGNSALESVLMMAGIASKVYLLTKYPNTKETKGGFPKGEDILIEKVKALSHVEIIYNARTKEIFGEGRVAGLKYDDTETKEEKTIAVDGVMVHIGMIPNSQFVECVKKNALGEIEIDLIGDTSCKGVFAAGDVTNIPYKQIAIAAGQGVVAALSAIDYINKWKK